MTLIQEHSVIDHKPVDIKTIWRVEIKEKNGGFDASGEGVRKDILDLGISSVKKVSVIQVFMLKGQASADEISRIAAELLSDPVTQTYTVSRSLTPPEAGTSSDQEIVEIAYNPGVMDPVEESTLKGIRDMGIRSVENVHTARQYHLYGRISPQEKNVIVNKVLSNKLIQHTVTRDHVHYAGTAGMHGKAFRLITVEMLKAGRTQLKDISREGQLFLNIDEMTFIRDYFRALKRNPTDCELETIAQTWSEHCYHKTFRGDIRCRFSEKGKQKTFVIHSLLKSTIIKATQKIGKPWCVSVFHDNAGIIRFDDQYNICFKVETHNHPSALEPFGGANTGIGGVIRDVLGTGLGAKPVCSTDIFCFAPPDYPFEKLPPGTLHPKRVMKGVVSGVRDYGNKMGIPTVNGAILFDERFVGNPLVYCGNVGLIPKGMENKKVSAGDLIVVTGGKTGRDGIHGATFSSGELTTESEEISSGAVQIGDPIQEKKMMDVLLQARDEHLYTAVTDCGAGGLSSAVGEMGKDTGAKVDLDKVPLKYAGLNYTEIWISESQERMVLSVHPKQISRLLKLFADENVEATVIGEFSGSGRLELFFEGHRVCDLDMAFLHDGPPKTTKEAVWAFPKSKEPKFECPENLNEFLLNTLSHYNVCSKEWVIRQYDHEVQGSSVIKPLSGKDCDGPSDASVITPRLGSRQGVAISNGINFRYGMIDPYWMAASCIDEAVRQIIAVGGNAERIALLDNFCWGNPDKPDRLGGLVRAAQGCYQFSTAYGTPFISGKDSLYNEYAEGKKSIAIPGTLLISAIGIIEDVTKCVTMDLKGSGNALYVVGLTQDEMGGSVYYDTLGYLGVNVPRLNPKTNLKIYNVLSKAVRHGFIRSMHDCSEGGLGVCLAEMAFSGGLGVTVMLKDVPYRWSVKRNDNVLFSESNGRLVVEVSPRDQKKFEGLLKGLPFGRIGTVEETPEFVVYGLDQQPCINTYIDELKAAWQQPLKW